MLVGLGRSILPIEDPVAVESWAKEILPIEMKPNIIKSFKKPLLLTYFFAFNCYSFFKACLMIISTDACGSSFTIASQTFSAFLRTKPNVSNADNASFLLVLLVSTEMSDRPYIFKILSFKSNTILCAVLAPIPLADCMVGRSFEATASTI